MAHDFVLSTDAADRNGVGLIGVYGFRYTPSPVITRVEGPTRANPDAPFLIRFGYPMDWDATVPALFIEPPIDAEIHRLDEPTPGSYTKLTLPTNDLVEISVGAVTFKKKKKNK